MNTRTTGITLLTSLACAVAAYSQTSTTSGAVRGTVRSQKGGVIAGASVILRNLETGFAKTGATDARGAYLFSFLPIGSYELTVTSPGLKSAKDSSVRVSIGQTATQNFTLDSAEATAVVEVVADSAGVDTAQINTQTSITQELVEAVPINNRNFTDLVQLTPGAAVGGTSYYTSVEGARGVQNNLQIDGASFNSRFNSEQRGGTRIPFSFGQDSIKELQVITNSFDAQYGDAVGAVINAVTKSGTNETTGMAFFLFRPNSLVAKVRPVPYDPKGALNSEEARTRNFQSVQGGFNLGGPIIKDKLHYFINVEAVRKREDSLPTFGYITTPGSGNTLADYNLFFGAGGMGNLMVTMPGRTLAQENGRAWTDEQKNLAVTGRLDWSINSNHRATLRLNSQTYKGLNDIYSSSRRSDVAESGNSTMEFNSLSTVLELQSILTPNLLNEARIQVSTEKRPITPNSTISSPVRIARVGTSYIINAGQYYLDPRTTEEKTTQIQDNLTFMTGDWTFKGGVDLQFINMDNRFLPSGKGNWNFPSYQAAQQWFLGSAPSGVSYTQGYSPLDGVSSFDEKYFAGYAQAQYGGLFNRRLLLSLGLRYTAEIWSDNPNPNPKLQGLDRAPNDSSLDPRFGFTLDLFGNSKTVIRGGYGWFSVANPGQTVSGAIMNNGINLLNYYVAASSAPDAFTTGPLSAAQRWSGSTALPGSLTPVPVATLLSDATFRADTVSPTIIDPDAKMTQARAVSLGAEQDLGNGYTVGIRGTYKQFRNLQYAVNINLAQYTEAGAIGTGIYNDGYPTTRNEFSTSTAFRPYRAIVRGRQLDLSGFGDVILSKYDGEGRYRSLVLEASRRGPWGFKASATFAKAEDNNSNERATLNSASALTENPADPLASYSLSDNDHKFRFTLAWYAPAFYGIKVSGITTATTGRPWNATYYGDDNGDGKYIDTYGGRNAYRQPSEKTFDLRISRKFRFSKRFALQGTIDVFNVFNWANQYTSQTTYTIDSNNTVLNENFGALDRPDNRTREVQFTVKFWF